MHEAWRAPKALVELDDCGLTLRMWSGAPTANGWRLCGELLLPTVREAFDLVTRKPVPFAEVADTVRRSIKEENRLTAKELKPYLGDPLDWAKRPWSGGGAPGPERFRVRHP